MKPLNTLYFLLAILLIGTACSKQSYNSSKEIPENVKKNFAADYPNISGAEWEQEGNYYEVEWEENNSERELVYDADGNLVAAEMEIAISSLPSSVRNYISQNYSGWSIEEAEEISKGEQTFYEVEIEKGLSEKELLFDSSGNLQSEEDDDDADDDDED